MSVRGRYYNGKLVEAELSPVTDLAEGECRQHRAGDCTRGGFCSFLHLLRASVKLTHLK